MLTETLDFIKLYLESLSQSVKTMDGNLTRTHRIWLGFCLTGIILTNSICWKAWERWSGGEYADSALSWMLRHAPIPWSFLLIASTNLILKRYSIKQGVLVIRRHAKMTPLRYENYPPPPGGANFRRNGGIFIMQDKKIDPLNNFELQGDKMQQPYDVKGV